MNWKMIGDDDRVVVKSLSDKRPFVKKGKRPDKPLSVGKAGQTEELLSGEVVFGVFLKGEVA